MHDATLARTVRVRRFARIALTTASICAFSTTIAHAEVHDPMRGYSFDGTPTGGAAPAPRAHERAAARDQSERPAGPMYVSSGRIRRMAARQGYSLTSAPRRHGHAYFATAQNGAGHRFELIFNAANGFIASARDLGPIVAGQPEETAPTAAAAPAAPTPAPAAVAAEPAPEAPTDAAIAAAKDAVLKAQQAETEAKQLAQQRAAEARDAQAKLATAEADARRVAAAKAEEAR
ncbi:MAG: hypothetical protein OTI36_10815, partial [Beijerinckiaceae bacterium]|nr:hypothetical protein [Beijerinckiaceae bacterium]